MVEEYDIMYSSDNSIKLTNYRIIQRGDSFEKEILIKDYIDSEVITQSTGNYGTRAIILALVFFFLVRPPVLVRDIIGPMLDEGILQIFVMIVFVAGIILSSLGSIISLIMYFLGLRTYLNINGKYSTITVQLGRWSRGKNKFVERIETLQRELTPLSRRIQDKEETH